MFSTLKLLCLVERKRNNLQRRGCGPRWEGAGVRLTVHPQSRSLPILLSELGSERKVLSKETDSPCPREWKFWKLQWEQFYCDQVLLSKNFHSIPCCRRSEQRLQNGVTDPCLGAERSSNSKESCEAFPRIARTNRAFHAQNKGLWPSSVWLRSAKL